MIDDYQYQPQPLPPKNEGLFGYGGKPNEGSRGFQGDIVDYGGTGGGGGLGQEGQTNMFTFLVLMTKPFNCFNLNWNPQRSHIAIAFFPDANLFPITQ